MNSLWAPRNSSTEAGAALQKPDEPMADTTASASTASSTDPEPSGQLDPPQDARPLLVRNASNPLPPALPPPPNQPPPPPIGNVPPNPQDSMSLAQLRRMLVDFPETKAVAYDFTYEDMGPIDEEIDEWFVYHNFWQWGRLSASQRAFEEAWERTTGVDSTWDSADDETRKRLVANALDTLKSPESKERSSALGTLVYIVLGRWAQTAGKTGVAAPLDSRARSASTPEQLAAMKAGVKLLGEVGAASVVWEALRKAFGPYWTDDAPHMESVNAQEAQDELMNTMTIMYMMIQHALVYPQELSVLYTELLGSKPCLVNYFVDVTARMRWDEAQVVPQAQVFLLFWKSMLLVFGGSEELKETKKATAQNLSDEKDHDTITASPLDYHFFRQEITSKYPAYIPPQEVIPLEPDNTSFLPPLPNQTARNNGASGILPPQPGTQTGGASILHQPVHIATPAPSPPPSPGVGGKGVKKQNYQTNQNFPLMYPPLDATSNNAGGKGNAALQALLVGRRWEGSDVPASILEAGELFSRRVRMTRALRQLWEEREKFMKFERGWDAPYDDPLDDLDLSSLTLEEKEELGLIKPSKQSELEAEEVAVDYGPRPESLSDRIKRRLDAVENFYAGSIPQLQSVCMCLIKGILAHYTILLSQQPSAAPFGAMQGANGRSNGVNGNGAPNADVSELPMEELDAIRTREITAKAVSGIMLLLLKWLKLSHVLKFEFLTQLLLDCNYMPLVLKLFLHQDVQQAVENKTDRIEHSFFYFCNIRAGASAQPADEHKDDEEEDSDNEAAPPPIKRHRSPPRLPQIDATTESGLNSGEFGKPGRPEVDELGYPVGPQPVEPITDFSRRNFFTLINYLRILQKICKNKGHRNLLMVQYKSSNVLRKNLKVPQNELRLYTLKLFKNQVPYCTRKWRQSNMRVITAIYLHCRPELRDEWLAGCDVDAEMEEALPLEQALRSLTRWFNVRRYPEQMAPEVREALREEQDFFVRELEKMEGSWDELGASEGAGEWDEGTSWA
ncbi:hypothetical protein BD289DRAFT_430307 [Coniella lustricola]|uniref:Factor arrest protein 11 n=1 Tax=Coniella lustricola TaxID=2025994 RepID=A0A2T3AC92_9PEZI|nr:hypothetical protein BD289DRAFT_430307 [Coniella lustricola]